MLHLLMMAAIASATPNTCAPIDRADAVTDERKLAGSNLDAVASSHPGDGPHGYVSSRVTVFRPDCTVAFDQQFGAYGEIALDVRDLARQPVLVVTTFQLGGSSCGVDHLLLGFRAGAPGKTGDVRVLASMPLDHPESGGFYIGDLGKGRGPGVAVWRPLSEGEGHAANHRYQMTVYRWANRQFSGPSVLTTRGKVGGEDVPSLLGFSLTDQSDLDRFGGC